MKCILKRVAKSQFSSIFFLYAGFFFHFEPIVTYLSYFIIKNFRNCVAVKKKDKRCVLVHFLGDYFSFMFLSNQEQIFSHLWLKTCENEVTTNYIEKIVLL